MFDESVLLKYSLPERTTNSSGLWYDPREDVWPVSSTRVQKLDLTKYRHASSPAFLQSLKLALVSLNRTLKPKTISNYLCMGLDPLIRRMAKPCEEITRADLEACWFSLPPARKYWFKGLKILSPALALHGIPGHSITDDALEYLKTIKPGKNESGEAARTWHPVKGPLTMDELDSFLRALIAAFVRAEVSIEDYILIWLFASFGARVSNLSDLKVCDLESTGNDGFVKYELHIPRVKQHGGRFRESFYTRRVLPEFGVLLEAYCQAQEQRYAGLGCGNQLPLFVDPGNTEPIRTYHSTTGRLLHKSKIVADRLNVLSMRTGEALQLTSRRYRYTVGTLARASGLDPVAIAALLDHGDTRTQEVYAAVSPEVLEDFTRRQAGYLTPLASAYMGRIGLPGDIPDPQRMVFRAVFKKDCPEPAVGSCEASRKCGGLKPYACYVCPLFVASMEGDHEGALQDVLEERVRFDEHAGDGLRFLTKDSVVQAICEVIAMVQERLREMGKTLEQIRQEKEMILREKGIIP